MLLLIIRLDCIILMIIELVVFTSEQYARFHQNGNGAIQK
ncbi:hypothetical protein ACVWVZ_000089 [Pseudomonas tolaasii]